MLQLSDLNISILFNLHFTTLQTSPKTFNEVFRRIFEYVDRLFSIVRPRKLLFLAIGGWRVFIISLCLVEGY